MSTATSARPRWIYTIECSAGTRYVIYNAAALGNPADYVPDKWYARPFPVGIGFEPGEAFDTAEQAESYVRARHESPGDRLSLAGDGPSFGPKSIEATCRDRSPDAEGRGHQLTVEMPARPACRVADPRRQEQVVVNLLDNAARSTNEADGSASVPEARGTRWS